jgi:hypothetical protein
VDAETIDLRRKTDACLYSSITEVDRVIGLETDREDRQQWQARHNTVDSF